MRKLLGKALILLTLILLSGTRASGLSFNLDSIAAWGKFPRFCVNTYRWGDRFFNTYDSTYVQGSGYKFNVKLTTDSWLNYYNFGLPNHIRMNMISDPSTSIGLYATYLAVSVGYDINVSNLFQGTSQARSRYRFGFDCSLLSVEVYLENNEVGTKIKRFGNETGLSIPFNDIAIHSWGIDAYYFFNHKKYSQSAAFGFGRIQHKSQGSFFAGLSIYSQSYDFDFNGLPMHMLDQLPEWWADHHYKVKTRNYGFRLGYGYNWAFARHWIAGFHFSPTIGFRTGFVNSNDKNTDLSLMVRGKASVVWNNKRWFAGIVGRIDSSIINDRKTTFMGNDMSLSAAIGYRFNLW